MPLVNYTKGKVRKAEIIQYKLQPIKAKRRNKLLYSIITWEVTLVITLLNFLEMKKMTVPENKLNQKGKIFLSSIDINLKLCRQRTKKLLELWFKKNSKESRIYLRMQVFFSSKSQTWIFQTDSNFHQSLNIDVCNFCTWTLGDLLNIICFLYIFFWLFAFRFV